MIAIQTGGRNGKVVAAKLVKREDEIMLITTGGVLIRTRVAEIRQMGRATQGVTLINLSAEEKLAGLEKVVESEENGVTELGADVSGAATGEPGVDAGLEDGELGSDDDTELGADRNGSEPEHDAGEDNDGDEPPPEPDNQ
jgi:DNA gyrase subunit A